MATRMGIRELRDGLTGAIRRARSGETIEVTHHGEPVALLVPAPTDRIEALVSSGVATAGAPLDELPSRYPVTGELSASAVLEEDRAER